MNKEKETTGKSSLFEKEKWEAKKKKLKEKFPELTDEDLALEEGKEDGMMEKIHSKIGNTIVKSKEGLHKFIEKL